MGGELKVISFKLSVLSSGQAENLELKTDNLLTWELSGESVD
jgi:hypothetical protein